MKIVGVNDYLRLWKADAQGFEYQQRRPDTLKVSAFEKDMDTHCYKNGRQSQGTPAPID